MYCSLLSLCYHPVNVYCEEGLQHKYNTNLKKKVHIPMLVMCIHPSVIKTWQSDWLEMGMLCF